MHHSCAHVAPMHLVEKIRALPLSGPLTSSSSRPQLGTRVGKMETQLADQRRAPRARTSHIGLGSDRAALAWLSALALLALLPDAEQHASDATAHHGV